MTNSGDERQTPTTTAVALTARRVREMGASSGRGGNERLGCPFIEREGRGKDGLPGGRGERSAVHHGTIDEGESNGGVKGGRNRSSDVP
jgi:hypothetical protein